MVELDPEGVTITRALDNQFPGPADPAAADLLEAIYVAHAESDGPVVVDLCARFRREFGWHPRTEWYRVLGLEILNSEDLIEEQRTLLKSYAEGREGRLPADACVLAGDLNPTMFEWALGANHLNLMEWLWKRGDYEGVIENFPASLLGLAGNDDNGRRIERLLYRASSESRLGQSDLAAATLAEAKDLDSREWDVVWKLYAAKMPELATLIEV